MTVYWKQNLILLGILWSAASYASDDATRETLLGTSGPNRVQLLELYSSEGCSSCPPADQWVSGLKEKSGLWKTFVPVVFHVDYWNSLGWKDELSSEAMTKRQVAISNSWSTSRVYTPAIVVDGKEWLQWRNSTDHNLPAAPVATSIRLSLYRKADGSVNVKIEGQKKNSHYTLQVAQLAIDLTTKVTAGENSGKTLKHNFDVLKWENQKIDDKKSEVLFKFPKSDSRASRLAIAAWIEEEGNPTPLQAVGAYL
jgi:hypothetical protein